MEFLFDRLSREPAPTAARIQQGIMNQLEWLSGSREWRAELEGTALLDTAMPELPALGATEVDVRRYAQRLKRLIERQEPRLRRVQIDLVPTRSARSPFRLVVTGQLAFEGTESPVRFERDLAAR